MQAILKPRPGSAAAQLYSHTDVHVTSIRQVCHVVTKHWLFGVGAFLVIVSNVVCMGLRDEYCLQDCSDRLDMAEIAFQVFFILEIVVRILAAGSLSHFFKSGVNSFDFLITLLTVISSISQAASADQDLVRTLRGFTAFRTLRLMMFNQTLRYLLLFTVGSSTSVFNLLLFMMIVLFCFTSVGLYLFKIDVIDGGDYEAINLFAAYFIDMFQVKGAPSPSARTTMPCTLSFT